MKLQELSDQLILNAGSNSLPNKSKAMYEEALRENFKLFQHLVKQMANLRQEKQLLDSQIATLSGRISKLQTHVEDIHNEYRKGHNLIAKQLQIHKNVLNNFQNRIRLNYHHFERQSRQQIQSQKTIYKPINETLEKTKQIYEIFQEQEKLKRKNMAKQENISISFQSTTNKIEKKENDLFAFIQAKNNENKNIDHQVGEQRPLKKKKIFSSIRNKRRSAMSVGMRYDFLLKRKELMNHQKKKTGSFFIQESSRNTQKMIKQQEQSENSHNDPNKREFNEKGLERKLLNNLVSSQFTIEGIPDRFQSFTSDSNFQETFRHILKQQFHSYAKRQDLSTMFETIQQKLDKLHDLHIEKCADKQETKKAILYLQKKVNKIIDGKNSSIRKTQTEEINELTISRCLACNRIFPLESNVGKEDTRQKIESVDNKQKKIVYFGNKTSEPLPSQPPSLNKWKRRTAQLLKASVPSKFYVSKSNQNAFKAT